METDNLPHCPPLTFWFLVRAASRNGETALTRACADENEPFIRLLLSMGANTEQYNRKGLTPLMIAAMSGNVQIVGILLDTDAELEAEMPETKDTALSLACSAGHYAMVQYLLTRGANKEHCVASGLTPLGIAVSTGDLAITNLLLSYGAEIDKRTDMSPLMLAALKGDVKVTRLLLDHCSDGNVCSKSTQIMELTLACHRAHLKMAHQAAIRRGKQFGEIYENIANVVLAELKHRRSQRPFSAAH